MIKKKSKSAVELLNRLARTHELAVNAQLRWLQYAGYETGRKAKERFEHYQDLFERQYVELRETLRPTTPTGGESDE